MKTTTKIFLAIFGLAFAINVVSQENQREVRQLHFTQHDHLITDKEQDRDSIAAYTRLYYFDKKENSYFVTDIYSLTNTYRAGYSTTDPSLGISGFFASRSLSFDGKDTIISVGEYKVGQPIGEWTTFYQSDNFIANKKFYDQEGKRTGNWRIWSRETGNIWNDEHYENDKLHGTSLYYFENGQLSAEELWENGELIDYKLFDEKGNRVIRENYMPMTMPAYKGGNEALLKFLQDNLVYPREMLRRSVTGTVIVRFMVESDGTLTNIRVHRGVHQLLDAEALRAVRRTQGHWSPGMFNNRKVDVSFDLPVRFTLLR